MIAHNLPPLSNSFVGRKQELAEIAERLIDPQCRLLTVVGPGGIGKTRLAIQVSSDVLESKAPHHIIFQDGVYFVSLQALISSDFNLSVIADSLNLRFSPDNDPEDQLLGYLRPKSMLLVLDNFEHLLDGVGLISRLLNAAPQLKILATSREALNLQEEWLYPLTGMNYPRSITAKTWNEYDALHLFAANAHRIYLSFSLDESYQAVIRICQLVEGMPLALELAASWVRSLSTTEIANEIENGMDILEARATNIPARHRSMRAMLDTSWNRLDNSEQTVFKKLSVFRGGFTRQAAQAVANTSRHTLASLVDKSWLRHQGTGRYDIHELLRQYGEEFLNQDSDQAEQTHNSHCSYYAGFLTKQWESLKGAKQKEALSQIEIELENIRSYWDWAIHHMRVVEIVPVLNSLWRFYDQGSRFHEGALAFAKAAKLVNKEENKLLYGQILARQGALLHSADRKIEAKVILLESLDILEGFDAPIDLAFCLIEIGRVVLQNDDDILRARDYIRKSIALYEECGDQAGLGISLLWFGLTYGFEQNSEMAWHFYQKSLAIETSNQNIWGLAEVTAQLSFIACRQKSYAEAAKLARQSLGYFQELGIVWGVAMANRYLSMAVFGLGQHKEALGYLLESLTIEAEFHLIRHALNSLVILARQWAEGGKTERAVELLSLQTQIKHNDFLGGALQLLTELELQLPADVFADALERGKLLDFETTLHNVIIELREPEPSSTTHFDLLTARELEILHLIARGFSNRAIANDLVLALSSVKWYVSEILGKLGVSNRTQAVARARELNLLSN